MADEKAGLKDNKGEIVDLYVPRRCDWTNRLITAKDHASVRISIAAVSNEGLARVPEMVTFDLCGYIRHKGRADTALNQLAYQRGLLPREM